MANGLQVCPGIGDDEFEVLGCNAIGEVNAFGKVAHDDDCAKAVECFLYGFAVCQVGGLMGDFVGDLRCEVGRGCDADRSFISAAVFGL